MTGKQNEVSVIIRAKDATVAGLNEVKSRFTAWAGSLAGLVTGIGIGAAFGAIFSRMRDEVTGAQRATTQFENTLANIGIDFRKVKPDIDAAIGSLQKVVAIDDDDAVDVLNKLVQVSGDYSGSLKNLEIVANVAAAKQMDLSEAAELVGKVMAGTGSKGLKQFGISAKNAHDGIEQLRAKVKGAAETEMRTLDGSIKAANIAYGDMVQVIGEVIAESPGFQQFTKWVIDGLRDASTWLVQNKRLMGGWLSTILVGIKEAWTLLDHYVQAWVNLGVAAWAAADIIAHPFNSERREADLRMLNAALDNLGEALDYDVVTAYERVTHAAETAEAAQVGGIKRTTEELEKNKAAHLKAVAEKDAAEADAAAKKAKREQEERDRGLNQQVDDWTVVGMAGKNRGQAVAALADLQAQTEFLLRGNQSLARRAELLGRLAKIKEGIAKLTPKSQQPTLEELGDRAAGLRSSIGDDVAAGTERANKASAAAARNIKIGPSESPFGVKEKLGMALGASTFDDAKGAIIDIGQTFADVAAGPIAGFGDAIENSMELLVSGADGAGRAFRDSMIGAVRAVAAQKGKLFAGEALGALGAGFLGNPAGFAAAAKYGLAAAAMFALAGASGGLVARGSTGSESAGDAGARTQAAIAPAFQGSATAIFKGKNLLIDATDPDQRAAIAETLKTIAGNRELRIVYEDA